MSGPAEAEADACTEEETEATAGLVTPVIKLVAAKPPSPVTLGVSEWDADPDRGYGAVEEGEVGPGTGSAIELRATQTEVEVGFSSLQVMTGIKDDDVGVTGEAEVG